jgi:hypothetical protein
MTITPNDSYDPAMTMRAARDRYFEVNQFGADGGYDAPWVEFQVGPVPFPFPNSKARKRAVKVHDLHHILTGYDTNFLGEIEISAWELGAGCKDMVAAWALNLGGLGVFWLAPARIFRAFVRGRRSRSLYGDDVDASLSLTVAEARERMHVPPHDSDTKTTLGDLALFALAVAAGVAIGTALLIIAAPVAPIGYLVSKIRAARATHHPRDAQRPEGSR